MVGMATLGHVRERGTPRSGGRDGVGTCSDGTGPDFALSPTLPTPHKQKAVTVLGSILSQLTKDC